MTEKNVHIFYELCVCGTLIFGLVAGFAVGWCAAERSRGK